MDMGTQAMAATATAAMTAAMSSPTGAAKKGMDGMMGGCKISMLWNWYTVDACFIARSWRITSKGMFAGSCIGVILLVIGLEFVRRCQREYDRYIVRQARSALHTPLASEADSDGAQPGTPKGNVAVHLSAGRNVLTPLSFRPSLVQQLIRAGFYMVQFGAAYFVMLLAMYYNGYFIICILIGAFLGYALFGYDNIVLGGTQETGTSCC